jgi:signal transduction histidine kinase
MNSCYIFITSLSANQVILAKYSHIIPIVLSLFLALFIFFRAKFNLFSKIFLFFVLTFSFWLIGDLITWTSYNYNLTYSSWSALGFIEIIFYILGFYFILVFNNKKDISFLKKTLLILLAAPAFFIVILKQSLLGFNQPVCEAIDNNYLSIYKLIVEGILLILMLYHLILPFIKKLAYKNKKSSLILVGSMFIFLSIFAVTEYIASTTGYYEINLYSLFLLPVFLILIIYAVFELDIFNFRLLSTHYLVTGFVILMGGQLFFVNGTVDRWLTIITTCLTIALSIILFRNLRRESNQRIHIEELSKELKQSKYRLEDANKRLEGLDKLKTDFVSFASHQLRSPLTAIKGYSSMLLEGDYGEINKKAKDIIERIMESSNNLYLVVEDLLNITKIEQGGMKYEMNKFDFSELIKDTIKDLMITVENKKLKLICNINSNQKYFINGDKEKLRQVLMNLLDNSIKYTNEGQIEIDLKKKDDKVILSVKDTGIGISKETMVTLFKKFSREDRAKLNSSGSGIGLYLVKEIVDAHNGQVWGESEGVGHGSTFFVEIDEVK